jgi:Family of unknown function (DUF6600)/FecR protein
MKWPVLIAVIVIPAFGQYQQGYPPPGYSGAPQGQYQYPGGQQGPYAYPQGPQGQPGYPPGAQGPQGPQGPYAGPESDVQGPGVARVSIADGDVSMRRGDAGEVVAAALNAPLEAGDSLLTGPNGRSEVQFDWVDMLRVGAQSEVRFSDLQPGRYQIEVAVGTVTFRVLGPTNAQIEISTPSVSVRPLGPGAYRVTVRPDGSSEITVRSGAADIFTPQGSQRLEQDQTMFARGNPASPEYRIVAAIPYDEWDHWNDWRDNQLQQQQAQAYQYVSPDIDGAGDLSNYGQWTDDSTYGPVWVPSEPADWAPYQDGRWIWEDYYGWTWLSYDPWGWAPYHYGRWFHGSEGWCWWPGPRYNHYFWHPALVAFFGWGAGGVGLGFGNIGWVPLAPFEAFHPWYGRGFYGGRLGGAYLARNFNLAGTYRNARVRDGITGVAADRFGRGSIGRSDLIRPGGEQLRTASLVRGQVPIAPGRESLRVSNRGVNMGAMPRTPANEHFFMTRQPARTTRMSFEQQRQGMEQVARRTFSSQVQGGGRSGAGWPSARTSQPGATGRAATPGDRAGGWQRFGQPGAGREATGREAPATRTGNAPAYRDGSATSGWHRFGEPAQHGLYSGDGHSYGAGSRGTQAPAHNGGFWGAFGDPRGREMAPGGGYRNSEGRGGYSRQAPSYSAPRQPSYSAPRYNGGGGRSYSAPRSEGGGRSGGGGGYRGGGGGYHGGGGSHGGGSHGGGGHRR